MSVSSHYIKIGGACLNQTPIDWKGNFQNIVDAINQAKKEQVQILCLPELCITAYGCEDLFLSDWVPQKAVEILLEIKVHCKGIVVALGLPIQFKGSLYNTTCLIDNGEIKGFYAKQFLANDGIHYEKRWFTEWKTGDQRSIEISGESLPIGDVTFELFGIKTGFEICEDAWHADRPASRLVEKGVELILNPSASHFAFGKSKTREELVVSSSKKFNCTYVYVNLLGNQSGRVIYDGDILIARKGSLIGRNKRLSFKSFELISCTLDLNSDINIPNVQDDWDEKNIEFTRAVSLALYDYLRKSRTAGFTLSLSGGADSSSIAVMVAEMINIGINELGAQQFATNFNLQFDETLGNEEIKKQFVRQLLTTAYQGTKNSSTYTFKSAQDLANSIGARFHNWDIDDVVKENTSIIEKAIGRKTSWDTDDISLQNIQARSRSPLIWMLANIRKQILLTTSNRSEGDVGYTTMDGDTSGSLAPIAGVDKEFILQWLKYAEKQLGYSGLLAVNNLSPSAELRPSEMEQTDEDDLMPYSILKSIEIHAIRDHKSPKEVLRNIKKEYQIDGEILKSYVRKFFKLWSINQWKRERLAPSFHLDDFNVDPKTWCRFPILSGSFVEELEFL
ncbi:MAG: NAD+ synthase (glutamine-hydrolyzing) [Cyclobacteriaceae bacterium]|jgi:NAD+ synthase (glutamine-hydrolysing)